jgi:hypothetical protein
MASEPWYNRSDSYTKQAQTASSTDPRASGQGSAARSALKVASAAGKGIARGAHAVSDFAANNSWGLRLFSFMASVSLFVLAILGLAGRITGSSSSASFYLFNAYMLILSLLIFIAECKDEWKGFQRLRPWVLDQFGFLQSNLGRGVYFIFIGLIWYGAWGMFWGLAGFVVMCVGLLYAAMHWRGAGSPVDPSPANKQHITLVEQDDLP